MTEGRSDGHDDCEVEDERGRGSRGRKFGIPRNKVNVNKNAEQEEKHKIRVDMPNWFEKGGRASLIDSQYRTHGHTHARYRAYLLLMGPLKAQIISNENVK